MDHYLPQIRITLDVIHAITTTPQALDYVYMQILNAMFIMKKNIYIGTILKKISLMDNKVKNFFHLS